VKGQTSYVLVISDFGLARIHDQATQLRSKTRLAGGETIVYAAPEIELYPDRVISRRYDIWSLGCIYLEFVIWLLYGFEELERFRQGIDGRFYTIRFAATTTIVQGTGNKLAEINQTAKDWIHKIKNDPRCGGTGVKRTAISRLIVLIEERLLVVGLNPNLSNPLSAHDKLEDEYQGTADFRAPVDIPPIQIRVIRPTRLSDEEQNHTIPQIARFTDSEKDERAYAPEVCDSIAAIIREVEIGAIAWVNRESTPWTGPPPSAA
jgi:serine/threonine protein kinase